MSVARVANHHRGPIIFPRSVKGDVLKSVICINPGCVEEIDSELWASLKDSPQVAHYVKVGILSEVKKADSVPAYEERTSDPEIPEHLQGDEQTGVEAKAKVKRAKTGTVEA